MLKWPKPSALARRLFLVGLPTAIAGIAAVVLLNIHVPTRIRLDLTVSRLLFRLAGTAPGDELFRSLDTRAVSLSNFGAAELRVEKLEKADPKRFDFDRSSYPDDSWTNIRLNGPQITFREGGPGTLPFLKIESAEHHGELLTVDPIRVKPDSSVILEISEIGHAEGEREQLKSTVDGRVRWSTEMELNVLLEMRTSSLNIFAHGPIQIQSRDCVLRSGEQTLETAGAETYRARLPLSDELVKVSTRDGPTNLFFVPKQKIVSDLLLAHSIEVMAPTFIREIANMTPQQRSMAQERYISSIEGESNNTISYIDYPKMDKIAVPKLAILHLSKNVSFSLESIEILQGASGLHVTLEGRPDLVYSELKENRKRTENYLLDLFTVLRASKLEAWLAVVAWFMSTTLAARKVVGELKRGK